MPRPAFSALVAGTVLLLATLAPTATGQASPFPGPDAVADRLRAAADHPWVTLHEVGASVSGRPILAVEVADPNGSVPREQRAVTLVITQQHGNEPAGTPAALDLLDVILARPKGRLASTLDNQVLVLLPMANPDGADTGQRANAHGVDINRDHIDLAEPESRAIHEALNRWDVHVALDHHEYGGLGFGNPVPVRVYDYDLTTLFPRHGNVRLPTVTAAKTLMYEGIWPEAEEAGYSANEYGEVTAAGVPVDETAGGPDPGILRNHLGLHNVAGLLVETRIDAHPNPFHDAERRVAIHRVVLQATLTYVHDHAETFVHAKQAASAEAERRPADRYVEGEATGPLEDAYRIWDGASVDAIVHAHRVPHGHGTLEERLDAPDAGRDVLVVNTRHALEGHAAALVHPDSSRAIAEGVPTDPLWGQPLPAMDPDDGVPPGRLAIPGPGSALAVLALLVAVLAGAAASTGRRKV